MAHTGMKLGIFLMERRSGARDADAPPAKG
jgi:hypothetical protein